MQYDLKIDRSAAEIGIRTAVIGLIEGVAAVPTEGTALDARMSQAGARLDATIAAAERSGVPAGFRELFARLGHPEQPTAFERLHTLIRKNGFKRINAIVDSYNLASLTLGTPIGAHDLDCVDGEIVIARAPQPIRFRPLFHEKEKSIPQGDLTYRAGDRVLCWMGKRDVDAHDFRIRETTTRVLIMAIGNPGTGRAFNEDVCRAAFENMRLVFPEATLQLRHGVVCEERAREDAML
jgi:DNA/RNA-binding domain of Phe-tRNA-synthetase-like protein